MKKGFTLIELLAVILILGIIALIAIPQVTNVIEDAKKGSAEVTGENYIKALNDKMVLNKLTGNTDNITDGMVGIGDLDVNINGQGPEFGMIGIESAKVEGSLMFINGYLVYCDENNKCEAGKATYGYFSKTGVLDFEQLEETRPTNKKVYLKVIMSEEIDQVIEGISLNNELSRGLLSISVAKKLGEAGGHPSPNSRRSLNLIQACFYDNNEEFCLNQFEYKKSKQKIIDYFEYNEAQGANPNDNTVICEINDSNAVCYDSSVGAGVDLNGKLAVADISGEFTCNVGGNIVRAACTSNE